MKMSKVKWTDEQQNAITKKGSNILVAAAAGSRKNSCFSRTFMSACIKRPHFNRFYPGNDFHKGCGS